MAGARKARWPAQPSEAVIGFWGDGPAPGRSPFRGGGEPKSVIDSERRRLQCLRLAIPGGTARKRGTGMTRAAFRSETGYGDAANRDDNRRMLCGDCSCVL